MKEGRGCYGQRQGGERWEGFERRWAGEMVEGFGKGKGGFGNKRGRESFDVLKEMVRRRGGEMEGQLMKGRRRGSLKVAWRKVATAASMTLETFIV